MKPAAGLLLAVAVSAAAGLGGFRATAPPFSRRAPDLPALDGVLPGVVAQAPEVRLDASNAWTVRRALADVEVAFRLDPGERAVLEVRLRAPDVDRAEGAALLIGTEPRVPIGFVRETATRLTRLGPTSDSLRGRTDDVPVRLVARGERLEATVGDAEAPLVAARARAFREGAVVLLAARGAVTLRDLRVTALGPPGPPREGGGVRARRIAFLVAPLAWVAALALLRRRGLGLGFLEAAGGAALALAPFAFALVLPPPVGPWAQLGRGALVAAGFLATLGVGLRARTPDLARLAVVALAAAGAWSVSAAVFERPVDAPLDAAAYEGTRLEPGFLDLECAAVRAGMPWLATHAFRGARLDPADGRPRVLVVGRSDGAVAAALDRALGGRAAVLDGSAPTGSYLAARTLLDVAGEAVRPAMVVLAGGPHPHVDDLDPRHLRPRARRTFVGRLADAATRDDPARVRAWTDERRDAVEARARALGAAFVAADDGAPAAAVSAVAAGLAPESDR